jgi:CheY-like chemotaxis protein
MKKNSALIVDDNKSNIEILEHFIKKYCREMKALDSSSPKTRSN